MLCPQNHHPPEAPLHHPRGEFGGRTRQRRAPVWWGLRTRPRARARPVTRGSLQPWPHRPPRLCPHPPQSSPRKSSPQRSLQVGRERRGQKVGRAEKPALPVSGWWSAVRAARDAWGSGCREEEVPARDQDLSALSRWQRLGGGPRGRPEVQQAAGVWRWGMGGDGGVWAGRCMLTPGSRPRSRDSCPDLTPSPCSPGDS